MALVLIDLENNMKLTVKTDDKVINAICTMYWELNERARFIHHVADIAEHFSKTIRDICKIVRENAIAESNDISCVRCDSFYIYDNRSDYTKHFQYKHHWECDACIIDEKVNINYQKKQIIENYNKQVFEQSYSPGPSYSFQEDVYLLALIKFSMYGDLPRLKEYQNCISDRLSPDIEYDMQLYRALLKHDLILLDPLTDPEHLSLNGDGNGCSYDMTKIKWLITLPENDGIKEYIEYLEGFCFDDSILIYFFDDLERVMDDLAYYECIAYLKHILREYKFYADPNDSSRLIFDKILKQYSVAQTYRLIWTAVVQISSETRRRYY